MNVIICGAGQVGFSIARYLSGEGNDVTVIDRDPQLIGHINESLDVQAMVGNASEPAMLAAANADEADMIIAVTYADEVNMVACQVAHSLFNVPTKIARIRQQSFLDPLWADLFSRDHMPIDVIISPEVEVARAINRRLLVPGAFDMIPLAEDKVRVIGVRCTEKCPVVNTPLRQLTELFPDLNVVVVGIARDGEASIPTSTDQMLPGDEVYFVSDTDHVSRVMEIFGHEEAEAHRLVIVGGGNIGTNLAKNIEAQEGVSAKVIEMDRDRARKIAELVPDTTVLQGDIFDEEILAEANISSADMVVAVTNDDETNVLGALLAKQYGVEQAIALVNRDSYASLVTKLGVDILVNPRSITVSQILHHIRQGRIRAVYSLWEGFGEIIEAEVLETSPLVGATLKDRKLPRGVIIGGIVRDGEVLIPRGDTDIRINDRVILLASTGTVREVEKLFAVRLEFI
ncbi:MAG TPA: Trk system potassium transporter TrkA [Rhodospirillaceae bacterium]|nr:Trk system potassium transporter TrkA [Rhodospirillaceae bacterium]HAT36302.1 Trk system potassium transporter TrkA [Rhodospirillaceae bacterium]